MKFESFDDIIFQRGSPLHNISLELKTGYIEIPDQYISTFEYLYRPSGLSKGIGNGEVALYWALNQKYGGKFQVEKSYKKEFADLLIDGIPAEIKGWDVDLLSGVPIKIGRFEKIHDIRRIINIVFGAYNVFYAGKYYGEKHGTQSYLSESSFGMNGLTRAFDCALKIKDIKLHQLDNVREILSYDMYAGLKSPEDFAAKTFYVLGKKKLIKKVGKNNFIINVRPDKIGRIEILQLGDLDKFNLDCIKNNGARVQCSELFLNLLAFCE